MVGTDANDPLQDAIMELEAFARGDLPISHYVKNDTPVRLGYAQRLAEITDR